ncbi:ParA family protein [Kistimonas asteriae]|uniref:ParA family protein n=1 Tax=Kistimonas asteriae TaxID=517724 RepID=UPI001BA7AF16
MTKIIANTNQKGGVGKTTSSFNLAKGLAARGYKVLFVDNDPQGHGTKAFFGDDIPSEIYTVSGKKIINGAANTLQIYINSEKAKPLTVNENIDIFGATESLAEVSTKEIVDVGFEFKEYLESLNYDFIIIDCLPSFGTMQTSALMAADYLFIPTTLDGYSVDGIEKLIEKSMNIKKRINSKLSLLGIMCNMVDGRDVVVERHFFDKLVRDYNEHMFSSRITQSKKVVEANTLQQSISEYSPSSIQAKQYQSLVSEVLDRVGS